MDTEGRSLALSHKKFGGKSVKDAQRQVELSNISVLSNGITALA